MYVFVCTIVVILTNACILFGCCKLQILILFDIDGTAGQWSHTHNCIDNNIHPGPKETIALENIEHNKE